MEENLCQLKKILTQLGNSNFVKFENLGLNGGNGLHV